MAELTVLFDGSCNLCRGSAARVGRYDRKKRIEFLDVNDPTVLKRLPQVKREEALLWMQAIDSSGKVFSGSDAWARIGGQLPGWKWVAWVLVVPGIHWLARKLYAWVARNRYRWNRTICEDGTCRQHLEKRSVWRS